ncbi:tetratricopeptide repeat protein [Candidatus Eisenbacteria bacterium]|uniref:Tetratricopeptide repeat protein n=1 Tax=Eiseniibacteriota bacterium TaxID=2212470 RepID=A0ABV6YIQ4_UNCEI
MTWVCAAKEALDGSGMKPTPSNPNGREQEDGSATRFRALRDILIAARELSGGDRSIYLAKACRDDLDLRDEIKSLLAHDESHPEVPRFGTLDVGLKEMLSDAVEDLATSEIPERIGNYRILRLLGEGGMGVVYEAEQQDPRRRVALKVISGGVFAGSRRIQLFRREIESLARLRHPGIATIYEAGRSDTGQHFFTMELVQGKPLQVYCEADRGGSIVDQQHLRTRLTLFLDICAAVNYAHQRGVVHRDLKPDNILVTHPAADSGNRMEPRTKILDFGLARLTDTDISLANIASKTGSMWGTLAYMSPEQVAGNREVIDLRSDVYSLGVILYEILTGQRPYNVDASFIHDYLRAIRETPPLRPSGLNRCVRGDVETIILKSLEKDVAQRYQSVSALAGDIERFLGSKPILARPPSTGYQLRRLAARHKTFSIFSASSVLFLLVVAVTMSVLFENQRRERNRAEMEARKAESISGFLQGMLASVDPAKGEHDMTMRAFLDTAAEDADKGLTGQPETLAAVKKTIGETYMALGLYEPALPMIESSLDLYLNMNVEPSIDVGSTLNALAVLHWRTANFSTADSLFRRSLSVYKALLGDVHPRVMRVLNNLAFVYHEQGKASEAEETLRQVLALRRQLPEGYDEDLAESLNNLAGVLIKQGKEEEAEPLLQEALVLKRRVYGLKHPSVAISLVNLAALLHGLGQFEDAEPAYREALDLSREIYGEEHPRVARILNNYASHLNFREEYEAAELLHRESIAMNRKLLGEAHPDFAQDLRNLAFNLLGQGRFAEAETLYRQGLSIVKEKLDSGHPHIGSSCTGLGASLLALGRAEEAEPLIRESLAIREASTPKSERLIAGSKSLLGACLAQLGHPEEAESLLLEAHPILLDSRRSFMLTKRASCRRLIELYEAWGKPERAALFRETLRLLDEK